jgi:hypothetical protein
MVRRAAIEPVPDGTLRVTELRPPARTETGGYTAVISDTMASHYFHFMESLIWLWSVQHAYLGGAPPARIVFTHAWDNAQQNRVQRHLLDVLYPGIPVLDATCPWPDLFENVLLYDRFAAETRLNKALEPAMAFARPHVIELSKRVREAVGAQASPQAAPRFLHVARAPTRCFSPDARKTLLGFVRPRGEVTEVDYGALPWQQQVRLTAAHDVLLGVHGNGLTNMLWMRPGSLVLEFFPDGAHHYDYQFLAELCGLDYFGFSGDAVFPAYSRFGLAYGHGDATNAPVTSLPLSEVGRVLEVWGEKRKSLLF